ncbi:3-dehydroquinate dehydratase, partial [Campylobacter jejuni]|nr:3-dehydroquinate dehydratase [Campylobacter jejuni]
LALMFIIQICEQIKNLRAMQQAQQTNK